RAGCAKAFSRAAASPACAAMSAMSAMSATRAGRVGSSDARRGMYFRTPLTTTRWPLSLAPPKQSWKSVMNPKVESFLHEATSTFSHVVYDHDGGHAAIIDPVMDYDAPTARTAFDSAQRLLDFVRAHSLTVDWILETHAHADHLSAAAWLRVHTGARVAIGRGI